MKFLFHLEFYVLIAPCMFMYFALVEKETNADTQMEYLSKNLKTAGKVVFKVLKLLV